MKHWSERALAAVCILAGIVACDPLATSNKSVTVTSISDLYVPAPSVVIGDLMRDSTGLAAPLSLLAFDPEGRVLTNQPVFLNVLDASIHVDAQGFVHGVVRDTAGARVVAGAGTLQTPIKRIVVSVKPEIATKGTAATAITFDGAVTDTAAQTNQAALILTLADGNAVGAQGFIVNYTIIRSPTPLTAGVATAYIGADAVKKSTRDTTDNLGVASRQVIIRQTAFGDNALITGTKTDTVVVRVTATYGAAAIAGTPVDYFIPIRKKP